MKTDSCVNHDINIVTLLGSIHQEDGIITYKQIVEKKKKKKNLLETISNIALSVIQRNV